MASIYLAVLPLPRHKSSLGTHSFIHSFVTSRSFSYFKFFPTVQEVTLKTNTLFSKMKFIAVSTIFMAVAIAAPALPVSIQSVEIIVLLPVLSMVNISSDRSKIWVRPLAIMRPLSLIWFSKPSRLAVLP